MWQKLARLKWVFRIPRVDLFRPRILFTLDGGERALAPEVLPVLSVFAKCRVPLTLFVCNRCDDGSENHRDAARLRDLAADRGVRLELASHSLSHREMDDSCPSAVAATVGGSVAAFRGAGVPVRGFRAPSLCIEGNYRACLAAMSDGAPGLRYDSSVSFESDLWGSAFHAIVARKGPHKVGGIWELPISCLDDYHLLVHKPRREAFALRYWSMEIAWWLRRRRYCLLLFHPDIIGRHGSLLERLLADCVGRYSPGTFMTCSDLVSELDGMSAGEVRAPNRAPATAGSA